MIIELQVMNAVAKFRKRRYDTVKARGLAISGKLDLRILLDRVAITFPACTSASKRFSR